MAYANGFAKDRMSRVMLTALNGEEEQLRGYDLRIDDYITKPFSMPVLLRKIGAILRRCRGEDRPGANLLRYLISGWNCTNCMAAVFQQ